MRRDSEPPRLAVWLLSRCSKARDAEALTGDLMEQYQAGKSPRWFWKQTMVAIAEGGWSELQGSGPQLSYALAGVVLLVLLGQRSLAVRHYLLWWQYPWPISMMMFDLGPLLVSAWGALPILWFGCGARSSFRGLLRTVASSLFFAGLHFCVLMALMPSAYGRGIAGAGFVRIVPGAISLMSLFVWLFVAARIGFGARRRYQACELR